MMKMASMSAQSSSGLRNPQAASGSIVVQQEPLVGGEFLVHNRFVIHILVLILFL